MTKTAAAIIPFWRKSSYSGGNNECVEVAESALHCVAVRDSKDPHGAVLTFAANAWESFIADVRSGRLES